MTSAILTSASAAGEMTGPVLTGYLMDHVTYMCYSYTLCAAIIMIIATFTGAVIYVKVAGIQRRELTLQDSDKSIYIPLQ